MFFKKTFLGLSFFSWPFLSQERQRSKIERSQISVCKILKKKITLGNVLPNIFMGKLKTKNHVSLSNNGHWE